MDALACLAVFLGFAAMGMAGTAIRRLGAPRGEVDKPKEGLRRAGGLWALRLCGCMCCALAAAALLRGQEPPDAKLQQLADDSRARAEGIEVNIAAEGRTTKAALHPSPLMQYSDAPRKIEMATLWVWQDEGHPVALCKVEAYRRKDGLPWLYCFASTSTEQVDATWPGRRRFHADKPGVEWAPLNGPEPQKTEAGRRLQMKELFRRFTATALNNGMDTSEELRPLARPLHEYSSPKHGVVQGVLCGFAGYGTNPDVVVALEGVRPAEGKDAPTSWRYGVVRMTASSISVSLDKVEVFTRPDLVREGDHGTWTHFWEGAPE